MGFGTAENAAADAPWQADILKLMDPSQAPSITTLSCNPLLPEGAEIVRRSFSQDLVSNRGDVLNVTVVSAKNTVGFYDMESQVSVEALSGES